MIPFTDAANPALFKTLTWSFSGNVSGFTGMAFEFPTTSAPPHSNTLEFKVPGTVSPGDYVINVAVSSNGVSSAMTPVTLRVLPPAGFQTMDNPEDVYETDMSGNIIESNGSQSTMTTGASTVPDFGVIYTSDAATARTVRPQATTIRGPYDPLSPPPSIISDLEDFKDLKRAGCYWVADFDNAGHDPTRGTIAYRGQYSLYGYCTKSLLWIYSYYTIGLDVNTLVPMPSIPVPGTCPQKMTDVDGLGLCPAQSRPIDIPQSNRAEFFTVGMTAIGLASGQSLWVPITYSGIYPINNKGVIYPDIDATLWGYPGHIPFPGPLQRLFMAQSILGIHYCTNLGRLAEVGCVPRDGAAEILRGNITNLPGDYSRNPRKYTPHHILPVCWGGNNAGANGVFLLRDDLDPEKYHVQFSAWWNPKSFSPDGTQYPVQAPDC
jgi:hypothetical protein